MKMLRDGLDRLAGMGLDVRPAARLVRGWVAPAGPVTGLVSIILPTRNRARTLPRAIDSVLAQGYRNWQLIVIDDGSTDDTAAVMRAYRAERRIQYLRRKPRGAAAARNAGLWAARGALVAYIDSDNDWDSAYLDSMVPAFADPEIHCAYGKLLLDEPGDAPRVLFEPFDRAALLKANFIDINVFMHRLALFKRLGGFDEELKRLIDWDLILRYTEYTPAVAVEHAAANYRFDGGNRITEGEMFSAANRRIRAKWRRITPTPRPIRVLYALWQYPQLSEMYIETELRALRRMGVEIEVWSEIGPSAAHPTAVTVHRGRLTDAIAACRADVVHVHWLNIALQVADQVLPLGLQVTVRGHGFDVTDNSIAPLLAHAAVRRVYLSAHQIETIGLADSRLAPMRAAFDMELFKPGTAKDRRMVLRASAALPAKDLRLFLELALRVPEYRFVLCIVSCTLAESYVGDLLALRRELQSPAEILLNVQPTQIATLMAAAGIYLHTVVPPEQPGGTPLGAPSSIAEAMASGCYMLVKNLPPLMDYVGDAGDAYADIDGAAFLIRATLDWDDEAWVAAGRRSADRAFGSFTGEDDFHALYEDWAAIVNV
jgi:glycosyltransferase involved in cell wall biosynthesis